MSSAQMAFEKRKARNAELKARNAELEAHNAELEARNAELEAKNARLINTAIAFITVEDYKEEMEAEGLYKKGEEWYDDDDIYSAFCYLCKEGYDKTEYYHAVHDYLRELSDDDA